jgi:DNA polymerase
MKIITLDFETFYSQTFSLSKMTTEQYIRSPEFEVIGVAVQVDDGEPVWFSGTKEQTKGFLSGLALQDNLVVAHNAVFDLAILSWHFDIKPKAIVDTLSMARAIHGTEVGGSLKVLAQHYELGVKGEEVLQALGKRRIDFAQEELHRYGMYCVNDVALTYGLFKQLSKDFPAVEYRLIDLTIRMFTEPSLKLNKQVLEEHMVTIKTEKERLLNSGTFTKEELMSNNKFAELLQALGVQPPLKVSPTTGKETWAFSKTDEEFKALLEHENPTVQVLAAARLGTKSTIEETRTQRFIDIADRGSLPIPLRYYAAHTGRWGGDDKVNMQNLPRTSKLKYAIEAPDGYLIVGSDSSQIEARTLAWLAEQNDLVDAFDRGEDVYKIMASSIYGKPVNDITKPERFMGKTTILGAGYGMGSVKFQAQLKRDNVDLSADETKRIIDVYRTTYEWIPILWRQGSMALEAIMADQSAPLGRNGVLVVEGRKGIRLPNGMYIKYPNLRSWTNNGKAELVYDTKKGKTTVPNRIYGGKVIENVCQALARIAIGEQMLQVAKKYKVVMTVHDEIVCVVPEAEVHEAQKYVEDCMRARPKWGKELPLNCESGFGKSYGEC